MRFAFLISESELYTWSRLYTLQNPIWGGYTALASLLIKQVITKVSKDIRTFARRG